LIEPLEQPIQRLGRNQRLTEIPQRIGIGNRIARTKAAKAHPAQPVAHQILGLVKRQPMHGLQNQHPELQHRIETRAEHLEINRRVQLLKRVAFRRKLFQALLNVPETALTWHLDPSTKSMPEGNHKSQRHASFRKRPDSFVHTLANYFRQTGARVSTVRSPVADEVN
jgi:hypothetical protein